MGGMFTPSFGGQAQNTVNNTVGMANANYPVAQKNLQNEIGQTGFNEANLYNAGFGGFQTGQQTGFWDSPISASVLQGYGGFAAPGGGITPANQAAMVNQATSGARNTNQALISAAQRNANATGGNALGAISGLQTALGENLSGATTNAQVALQNQINQNRFAGLGGQANVESNLAANRLAATQGIAGMYGTTANQYNTLNSQFLQSLKDQYGTDLQGAQILASMSANPTGFDNAIKDVGTLASAYSKAKGTG